MSRDIWKDNVIFPTVRRMKNVSVTAVLAIESDEEGRKRSGGKSKALLYSMAAVACLR